MQNKKGLSDVVTTVLIILLVVAAVSLVWVFIVPMIKNTGGAVNRGQTCFTNSVEPVTCKGSAAAGYVVSCNRKTDEKVNTLKSVKIALELIDGSVYNGMNSTLAVNMTNGATVSDRNTTAVLTNAKQVTITTEYNLVDGQVATCTSSALTCTQ